ncbi:MAG TPA: heme ABC transporter ATP-binding protein [Gammaproteobacteria bacterium]|jgi:iron complex transport system ATP-binding protein
MVELRSVNYRVGDVPILEDVSVAFPRGSFNVILGPNGAGKSTLLKLASGLIKPDSGEVLYAGEPASQLGLEGLARRRAVLSQHVEMAFPLPAEDVVMMGRYPHYGRSPSRHDRMIVDAALALVGIEARRKQDYTTLSGGEQQKVQLARVLAQVWAGDTTDARYLFLDEPVSSLDIHYQLHILDVARGLRGKGCTVVAILHDLNLALQYGDRFLVLEHGRVACDAEGAEHLPKEIIERVFAVHAEPNTGASGTYWRFSL